MARTPITKALLALLLTALFAVAACADDASSNSATPEPSFFDFVVDDIDGHAISLERYASKRAILVVNVASACGYTDQNYRELQTLYDKYNRQGLEILAFPCNQFGAQEPASNSEIRAFVTQTYDVTFPVFAKVDVNGKHAHPLFQFLTQSLTGFLTSDIKWNFSKFLVVDGVPHKRYATTTSPLAIERDIEAALARPAPTEESTTATGERQEL